MNELEKAGLTIVRTAAERYLAQKHLVADSTALAACCQSWLKIKLPQALADAREAFAAHMNQIGVQTFTTTLILAGIEAAKETGSPSIMRN